jgi:hypothetical protein
MRQALQVLAWLQINEKKSQMKNTETAHALCFCFRVLCYKNFGRPLFRLARALFIFVSWIALFRLGLLVGM